MQGLLRKSYAVLLVTAGILTAPLFTYVLCNAVKLFLCEHVGFHLFTAQYRKRLWMNLKAGIVQLLADWKCLASLDV